jgi:hypothetical protein
MREILFKPGFSLLGAARNHRFLPHITSAKAG